jgi:hypothetical protein
MLERLTAAQIRLRSPTGPGCRRRMTSRNLCVPWLAPSLCLLLPHKFFLTALRGDLFTVLLGIQQSFLSSLLLLCPAVRPRRIVTPTLPTIQFA